MTRKTRKTHKMRKVLLAVCCAALLVCVTIGATVAYLTSQDTVTNTFTVGNVQITLDEAAVNEYGERIDSNGKSEKDYGEDENFVPASRVTENTYKLLPGHTYTKDPTVHVAAGSEDCWLFVKLENGIKDIIDATTIEAQMVAKDWILIDATNNIYAYKNIVSKNTNVVVFDNFKITGDANVSSYTNAQINITAYAVQADGFNTAQAAWKATFGKPATTAD